MRKTQIVTYSFLLIAALVLGCSKSEPSAVTEPYAAIKAAFGNNIDLTSLNNYSKQSIPAYILKDNGTGNPITDAKATLGRVLFYDQQLSIDNSISCGSCHKQAFAFGDTARASSGVVTAIDLWPSLRKRKFLVQPKREAPQIIPHDVGAVKSACGSQMNFISHEVVGHQPRIAEGGLH